MGSQDSYESRDRRWWRPELHVRGGDSFDDDHRAAAFGTEPQNARFTTSQGLLNHLASRERTECLETKWQQSRAPAVREEAEVANADEAFGQQMHEKAAQELVQR